MVQGQKMNKNIENDVLKKIVIFVPPISLNFSDCKHARFLGHISFQKWDP